MTPTRRSTKQAAPRIPMPQAIGACTAFAAFSVSIVVGISSQNAVETVLSRALLAMLLSFVGGFAIGLVCDWIVTQQLELIQSADEAETADGAERTDDTDGLAGVDLRDEDDQRVASRAVQSENREAVGRRREKNSV